MSTLKPTDSSHSTSQPSSLVSASFTHLWQGPLPDPTSLEQYKKIDAELIPYLMSSEKAEQQTRHTLLLKESERNDLLVAATIRQMDQQSQIARRGQWLAYSLVLIAISATMTVGLLTRSPLITAAVGFVSSLPAIVNTLMGYRNKVSSES